MCSSCHGSGRSVLWGCRPITCSACGGTGRTVHSQQHGYDTYTGVSDNHVHGSSVVYIGAVVLGVGMLVATVIYNLVG